MNHPARRQKGPLSIRHPRLYELLGSFLFVLCFTLVVVTAGIVSVVLLQLFRAPDERALNVFLGCMLITFQRVEKLFIKLIRRRNTLSLAPALTEPSNKKTNKKTDTSCREGGVNHQEAVKKKVHTACAGNGCCPHPCFLSRRLRFCSEAMSRVSMLTLQRKRVRKTRSNIG